MQIWQCKIGECNESALRTTHPNGGADSPMRNAIRAGYIAVTGQEPQFIFSGWAAELTRSEREVVDDVPGDECLAMHRVREAAFRAKVLEITRKLYEQKITDTDGVTDLMALFDWRDER